VSFVDVGDAIWADHDGKHVYNNRLFTETRKHTNDEALEATTVTFLCVVWGCWWLNLSDTLVIRVLSKKERKKDTNYKALEATTVTLLFVVWECWCHDLKKMLFRPAYNERPTFQQKRKKDTNDNCDFAMCRLGVMVTQFEQNITASTPTITVLSKKQKQIRMMRLSRRWPWHCYVSFWDVSDAIWGKHTCRAPFFRFGMVRVAVCCNVLQFVAVCCSVLQCVAVCCSMLQCPARPMS